MILTEARSGRRRRRARRGAGHPRDRSARPGQHRRSRSTRSCSPAAARSASTPRRGVMRYLEERGIGFETARGASADRAGGDPLSTSASATRRFGPTPTAAIAPRARRDRRRSPRATSAPAPARPSASWAARRAMKGGIGTAAITLPDGLVVAALVAVNAVGDVIDPATGRVVAGVRTAGRQGLARRSRGRCVGAARAAGGAARGREHDDRRRRHQRHADQGAGDEGGADGARRPRARDLPAHTPATATRSSRSRPARDRRGEPHGSARWRPTSMAEAIVRAVQKAKSIRAIRPQATSS